MRRLLVIMVLGTMLAVSACQENAPKAEAPKAEAPKAEAAKNTTAAPAPAAAPAAKAMSIGVVDEERLYEESTLGVTANKLLQELNAKLQQELQQFQETKKDNATEADADSFRKAVQTYQEIMRSAQMQIFEQMRARVTEAISNYRQQQGLELILSKENALAYGAQADITEGVLAAVNAMPADDLKGPELKASNNLFDAAPAQ